MNISSLERNTEYLFKLHEKLITYCNISYPGPSPTEFQLYEHENEDLCEEVGEFRNKRKVSFAVPEIAMEISDEATTMDDESSENQNINIAQVRLF